MLGEHDSSMEGVTNDALLPAKDVLGAPVATFVVYDENEPAVPERMTIPVELNFAGERGDILAHTGQHIPIYPNPPNQIALMSSVQPGDLNANNVIYSKGSHEAQPVHFINTSSVSHNCASVPGVLNHPTLPESVQILTASPHRGPDDVLDFQYPSYLPTVTLNRTVHRPDLASQYRVYGDVPQASQRVNRAFYVSSQAPTTALLNAPSNFNSKIETLPYPPKHIVVQPKQPKIEVAESFPCSVESTTLRFEDQFASARACRQKSVQLESSALAKERADLEELRKQLHLKEKALNEKEERLNIIQNRNSTHPGGGHWSGVINEHIFSSQETRNSDSLIGQGLVDNISERYSSSNGAPAATSNGISEMLSQSSTFLDDLHENLEVNPRLIAKTYHRKPKKLYKISNGNSESPDSKNAHGHHDKKLIFSETLSNGASSITITPISCNVKPSEQSAHQFKALRNGQVKTEKLQCSTNEENLACIQETSYQHGSCGQTILFKKINVEGSPSLKIQKELTHRNSAVKKFPVQEVDSGNMNYSKIDYNCERLTPCGVSEKDSSEEQQSWDKLSPVASFIIASPEHNAFDVSEMNGSSSCGQEFSNRKSSLPSNVLNGSLGAVHHFNFVDQPTSANQLGVGHHTVLNHPDVEYLNTLNHNIDAGRPTVLTLSESVDGRNLIPQEKSVAYINSIPVQDEARYSKTLHSEDLRFMKTTPVAAPEPALRFLRKSCEDTQQNEVQYMETIPQPNHAGCVKTFSENNPVQYILPSNLNSMSSSFGESVAVVQEAPVASDAGRNVSSVGDDSPAEPNCPLSPARASNFEFRRQHSSVLLEAAPQNLNSIQRNDVDTVALEDAISPVVVAEDNDDSLMMCDDDSVPLEAVIERPRDMGTVESDRSIEIEAQEIRSSPEVADMSSPVLKTSHSSSENCNDDEPATSTVKMVSPSQLQAGNDSGFSRDSSSIENPHKISEDCREDLSAASKLSPKARVISPLDMENSPGTPDVYLHESEELDGDSHSNENCNERTSQFSFTGPAPQVENIVTLTPDSNSACSRDSCNAPMTDECQSTSVNLCQPDEACSTSVKDSDLLCHDSNSQVDTKSPLVACKEQSCLLPDSMNEFDDLLESSACDVSRCSYDEMEDDGALLPPSKRRILHPKLGEVSSDTDAARDVDLDENSFTNEQLTGKVQTSKSNIEKSSNSKRKQQNTRKGRKRAKRNSVKKYSFDSEDSDLSTSNQCGSCNDGIEYTSRSDLQQHILSVHNGLARAVGQSQDFTDAAKKIALKQVLAKGLKLVCKRCKASFVSLLGYEGHMKWCGKSVLERTQLCSKCGWSGTMFTIKNHVRNCSGLKKGDTTDRTEPKLQRTSKLKLHVSEHAPAESSDDQDSDNQTLETNHNADLTPRKNDYFLDLCKRVEKPTSEEQLTLWEAEAMEEKSLVCRFDSCGEIVKSIDEMNEHMVSCSFRPLEDFIYVCSLCDLTEGGLSLEDIMTHLLANHPEEMKQVSISRKQSRFRKFPPKKLSIDYQKILSSLLEYRKVNHSAHLFQDWRVRMSEWKVLNNPQYFSESTTSPKFCINNNKDKTSWQTLDIFEGMTYENNGYFFCGGCITASAWCTTPCESKQSQNFDQILALGVFSGDGDIVITSPQNFHGTIQIWNLGPLGRVPSSNAVTPTLSLHIAHNFGCVTDMQWCPSGTFDPVGSGNRLGVLAAACSSGDVHIWFIPHLQLLPQAPHRSYLKPPDLTLSQVSFGDEDEVSSIPLALDWLPSKGHSLMAASMSDGTVCMWNFQASDLITDALETRVLYPCRSLNAHFGPSSAVAWCPNTNGANIATGGDDRMHHVWDLEGFSGPARLSTIRRDIVTGTRWPINTSATVVSFEDSISDGCTAAFRDCGFFGYTLSYCKSKSPTWSLSFSDALGAILQGTQIGECILTFPKDLFKVSQEKFYNQHRICFSASVQNFRPASSKKNTPQEPGIIFQHTPDLSESKSSRSADPVSVKSGPTPADDKAATNERSMKGNTELICITSVNFNPNIGAHNWFFCGYKCGLARVLHVPS